MENIVSLRNIPWLMEEPLDLREYFEDYHRLLDKTTNTDHQRVIKYIMEFSYIILVVPWQ